MRISECRTRGLIAFAATLSAAPATWAGDLNPPAGMVDSTMKTLVEVEPRTAVNATNTPGDADSLFKIIQSGSYYLTGNITGESAKHGIEIAASAVTLDLKGFELLGVPGSLYGIYADTAGVKVTVLNGHVRSWGQGGVLVFANGNPDSARVEGITATDNTGSGISVGRGSLVSGCVANTNGGNGISASFDCIVTHCVARANVGDGITATAGSSVYASMAADNGDDGIFAGTKSAVMGCAANDNTGDGIEVTSDCRVSDNTSTTNGAAGVRAASIDNRVEGNYVTDNARGIDVDSSGNLIIRNTAAGNTTNYEIVANNKVGVIVSAPNSAAISGSTGGAGVGTTDPWANLSF